MQALAWLVVMEEPAIHCFHHVVHNEDVVARFERLGVTFVDDPDEVPAGATVLLSAHGTGPARRAEIERRAGRTVDAVCPLVAKVHREVVARTAAGDRILYVGRPGHDETDGVLGLVPERTTLVTGPADVAGAPVGSGERIAVLAQTTLRIDEVEAAEAAARRRFGEVWTPPRGDICDASTTRQAAVRQVAARCDVVVVVGSTASSNTASLVVAALEAGARRAIRVARADELPGDLDGTVAVTAGASTPDHLVDAVIDRLGGADGAEVVHGPVERFGHFPLPSAIRRLVEERAAAGELDPSLAAPRTDPALTAEDLLRWAEARCGSSTVPTAAAR